MAGHAGRNQVGRWSREHRPEKREIGEATPVDRLGDRHSLGRAIAAAGDRVEPEIRGARGRDLVQLREALRVAGEGEQLRTGEAVGDVDGAAGVSIETLGRVRFDLDVDLADLRAWAPVVREGAELQAVAGIPLIQVVRATSGRNGSVEAGIVQPVRW